MCAGGIQHINEAVFDMMSRTNACKRMTDDAAAVAWLCMAAPSNRNCTMRQHMLDNAQQQLTSAGHI
jgi:hypothetical protein